LNNKLCLLLYYHVRISQNRNIYHLVKERGFTLKGAKEKLNQNRDKTIENAEIVISLQKIKTFLLDLKEQLDNLPVLTDQE